MFGICDECERDIPSEQHKPECRYHPENYSEGEPEPDAEPVDYDTFEAEAEDDFPGYLINGTPERGYCIFNAATGDRIVERGQYVQGFAYKADALAWVAAQD